MIFVATRPGVHVVRSGVFFACVLGNLPAKVFGARRVVGMGGVFTRVFLVASLITGMVFVRFRAGGGGRHSDGSLDRTRIGLGHCCGDFACMKMAVLVIGMAVLIMGMLMVVRMLVIVVIMMVVIVIVVIMTFCVTAVLRIVMVKPGVVGVIAFRVLVVVVLVVVVRVDVTRPCGRLRLEARVVDDLALDTLAIAAAARVAMARAAPVGAVFGFFLGLAMGAFIGFDQRLAIGDRDLVIVRMNFAEGEKSVTVAAILDEGGLQGGLYARDLGEIDIAAQLFALGGLEIKLFDAIAADHNDPSFFRVGGIDQHFVGHFGTLGGGGRVSRCARIARPGDATVHLIWG